MRSMTAFSREYSLELWVSGIDFVRAFQRYPLRPNILKERPMRNPFLLIDHPLRLISQCAFIKHDLIFGLNYRLIEFAHRPVTHHHSL